MKKMPKMPKPEMPMAKMPPANMPMKPMMPGMGPGMMGKGHEEHKGMMTDHGTHVEWKRASK